MSIRRSRTIVSFVSVACAVVLSVTACGSDDGGPSQASIGTDVTDVSEGANPEDVMFAQMMIPHHEQAVVMADLAVDRAEDAQLLALAGEIKAAQDPEIELMASWLDQWGVPRMSGDDAMMSHGSHGMQGMLSDAQLDALASAQGPTFDAMFAQYMIEHHEGAVTMAEDVVARGSHPAVAALAREIIVTQEKEIVQLRAFLSGESTAALVEISPSLSHVHGVVVDGDGLLLGTHDGVHRVDPESGASERVGESRDDFMGFAGAADATLVASGHPGPGSTHPNPLGLITSDDGGQTWQSVSLLGQVDFHGLAVRGNEIVGWDTRGPLQWSSDGGTTWQAGPLVTPTSVAWFDDRVWLGTPDRGLITWAPGQEGVDQLGVPGVLVSASPSGSALWRLDGDGSVHRSADGDNWTAVGRASRVEAFASADEVAYVATGTSIETLVATQ
ncbi:MAG: DUF305 domain-containing protein [Actinomycetota bacterium]|nr:DUF305 domain-containing protein [Actinomycetota bacterium]